MSRFTKCRKRSTVSNFVGVILSREQEQEVEALAADLDVSREHVLRVGLWLLSKIGRAGRELAVYTEWGK